MLLDEISDCRGLTRHKGATRPHGFRRVDRQSIRHLHAYW
jgi:hypothetical protein